MKNINWWINKRFKQNPNKFGIVVLSILRFLLFLFMVLLFTIH
jgi:hypothetical protein